MSDSVNYVISKENWDDNFEQVNMSSKDLVTVDYSTNNLFSIY